MHKTPTLWSLEKGQIYIVLLIFLIRGYFQLKLVTSRSQ
uniref:Uncharacterized protein n=1 Tax=Rhizophora mucronata TaxID=61149 RepID=A0A2P2PK80_RHIMU